MSVRMLETSGIFLIFCMCCQKSHAVELTRNIIKVAGDKLLVFDPKEEDDDFFYRGVKQNNRDFTKKAHKDAHFAFDGVFPNTASNQEVFEGTTKAVVDAVLEGFNCSGKIQ